MLGERFLSRLTLPLRMTRIERQASDKALARSHKRSAHSIPECYLRSARSSSRLGRARLGNRGKRSQREPCFVGMSTAMPNRRRSGRPVGHGSDFACASDRWALGISKAMSDRSAVLRRCPRLELHYLLRGEFLAGRSGASPYHASLNSSSQHGSLPP
jgi:hypothetical protein